MKIARRLSRFVSAFPIAGEWCYLPPDGIVVGGKIRGQDNIGLP